MTPRDSAVAPRFVSHRAVAFREQYVSHHCATLNEVRYADQCVFHQSRILIALDNESRFAHTSYYYPTVRQPLYLYSLSRNGRMSVEHFRGKKSAVCIIRTH